MRILLILCLSEALFCLGIFGHSTKDEHHHAKDHHEDNHVKTSPLCTNISPLQKIIPSNIKFAYHLYTHLATKYPNDNIFFSPVSISMLFSMISAGAKGQTQTEILEGLGFNTSSVSEEDIHRGFQQFISILDASNRDVELHTANALFVQKNTKLLEKFLEDLKVFYHSEAISTDFHNTEEAKNQINSYVASKTNEKIKDLLDSVDPTTLLVLVNTIYFKVSLFYIIYTSSDLSLDLQAIHKSVVSVNEKGTEAAGASAAGISRNMLPPLFEANRPFLMTILDKLTGSVLFTGRIMRPEN
ncbi:alpha-1-antiproteinase 2-like [Hyperolius riggenbachi]|uniref:alpha-1-antiproteinase 2-like n=1 Tax=Hyperolius riggenbachi TaxID=752182 RepID=UPI0035A3CC73